MPKAAPQFLHAAFHLATERFDCLHCGDLFPQGLNAVFLSKMFHLPFLIYCHGDEVSQTDCRQFQPRVRNYIYERADFVTAANQFAVDRLLRIGIAKNKIAKLTPGVDMKRFFPAPPRQDLIDRYGLQGHKVLLTVARLVPRKGHKVVLEALSNVIKEMPRLKYIIAGEGPEKGNLEQLVQNLGLQEHVIFVGNIPNAEISNYYNLCDVFAMVNRLEIGGDIESFGMVFTEANATGKPVIGGRSGGTDESVIDGETGFLVDPNDPQELSDRLLLLLKNGDLCLRMGTAGLHRVQSQFDWNSRALALRNIVVEVVQRFRTDTRNGQ